MDKNNKDQNQFIVDNLMVDGSIKDKPEKHIEEKEEFVIPEKDPYSLTIDDEKYFKLYIGSNYNSITKKKFNMAAFLLCGVYFLYRKCYVIGIVWIVLNLLFLTLLPLLEVNYFVMLAVLFVSHLACGCVANTTYLQSIGFKVVDFRNKDPKNLKKNLINAGGTNFIVAFLPFLLLSVIYSLLLYSDTKKFIDGQKDPEMPKANPVSKPKIKKYNYSGTLPINESSDLKEIITISVPEDFNDLSNDYSYKYLNGDNELIPKCLIEFYELNMSETPKGLMLGIASYYNELEENVKDIDSNLTWSNLNVIDKTKETSFNAVVLDNKKYILKGTYTDASKGSCTLVIDEIINSIN